MKTLISSQVIAARVLELSDALSKFYAFKNPLFVGILDGALPFSNLILKNMRITFDLDWMKIKSYAGTTAGNIEIYQSPRVSPNQRDILILEDIVDSGKSLCFLKDFFLKQGAQSVCCASLLFKEKETPSIEEPDWYGFKIPDLFVVGFGMDHNEKYRELENISFLAKGEL